jgi:type II secretion system (T2SS) protein E
LKTLGEIAVEAGLVTKAGAAKAGRMAEERKQPLVVMLVRELGVDEVALVGALRKQTRIPLIDPKDVTIDPEALRSVSRDVCARLRVLPVAVATDGQGKLLKVAMADPTDTSAIAELEELTHCDIEVSTLPLSTIDELVDKGYRQVNTAVVNRPSNPGGTMFVTSRGKIPTETTESEVSVTAQIPVAILTATAPDDLESRLTALVSVLVSKGLVTETELAEALKKLKP